MHSHLPSIFFWVSEILYFYSIIIHESICADTIIRNVDDCTSGRFGISFLNRYSLMSKKQLPLDIQFLGEIVLFRGYIHN